MDAHKNFAVSTVATAPTPATSGTSLVVAAGQGTLFPAVPFNATIWPVSVSATSANAEIVRVTAISTDTFTITRAQESSTARSVFVGDQIAATITALSFTDIETSRRELLVADRTYYIRTDGSDSNTGLANTSGGAFLTIQKGVDVASALDVGVWTVTLQLADGTYNGQVILKSFVGGGWIIIQGNAGTPTNVVVNHTAGSVVSATAITGLWKIKDFRVKSTTNGHLVYVQFAYLAIAGIDFNVAAGGYYHMECFAGFIEPTANYTISGAAGRHLSVEAGGTYMGSGRTVTLSGTPAFSSAFAFTYSTGYISAQSMTWSGSATGPRYSAAANSLIYTSSGGASFFPGDSAGSTATGGLYL
jgi:hypothetical protein